MKRQALIDGLTFEPFVFEEEPNNSEYERDYKRPTQETRGRVRAGAVLKLKDGDVYFVGECNTRLGVCDDCCEFKYEDIVEIAYLWGPEHRNDIERVFAISAERWKAETKFLSDATKIVLHRDYQRIIDLGPEVIPYILERIGVGEGHWSWALESITGDHPIEAEHHGNSHAVRDAWIRWGIEHGYLKEGCSHPWHDEPYGSVGRCPGCGI